MMAFVSTLCLCLLRHVHAEAPGCSSDERCLALSDPTLWRCLVVEGNATNGVSPCTVDAGFNRTGVCRCGTQQCKPGSYATPTAGLQQYLVIGDSVSEGYFAYLRDSLKGDFEPFHAPGNNDNANWGQRCVRSWLGTDPHRWDVISLNFGLHEYAAPSPDALATAFR